MRTWRREIVSVALVLALPVVLGFVFPYEALGFRASSEPAREPSFSAAFVVLTPDAEATAVRAARLAWQRDAAGRRPRNRLPLGELPDERPDAPRVLPLDPVVPETPASVPYRPVPWAPSEAAAAPAVLAAPRDVPETRAFSRDDLLTLPGKE